MAATRASSNLIAGLQPAALAKAKEAEAELRTSELTASTHLMLWQLRDEEVEALTRYGSRAWAHFGGDGRAAVARGRPPVLQGRSVPGWRRRRSR
jgi:hypothetical protein